MTPPPQDGRYLVFIAGYIRPEDAADIADYRNGRWQYRDDFTIADAGGEVERWQPLPAAETFNRDLSAAPLHKAILRLDANGEIDIGIRRAKAGEPEWSPGKIVGWATATGDNQ